MTSLHDSEHSNWLRDFVARDARPADGGELRRLAECPHCRSEYESLMRTQDTLERAGREELRTRLALDRRRPSRARSAVSDFVHARLGERPLATGAERPQALPTAARALQTGSGTRARPAPLVAPLAAPQTRPVARRGRRFEWIAAAAAATVLVGWLIEHLRTVAVTPPESPMLGQRSSDPRLYPSGAHSAFDTFRWELQRAPHERYRFSAYSDSQDRRGELLFDTLLDETTWSGDTSSWPDEIYWVVQIEDATGAVRDPRRAYASRAASNAR
ncbi:MAG: hypothetical protein IT454_06055 [Planctomycetes bacterium]|nr:hypothetical protein [Planctomycetota bacterium]